MGDIGRVGFLGDSDHGRKRRGKAGPAWGPLSEAGKRTAGGEGGGVPTISKQPPRDESCALWTGGNHAGSNRSSNKKLPRVTIELDAVGEGDSRSRDFASEAGVSSTRQRRGSWLGCGGGRHEPPNTAAAGGGGGVHDSSADDDGGGGGGFYTIRLRFSMATSCTCPGDYKSLAVRIIGRGGTTESVRRGHRQLHSGLITILSEAANRVGARHQVTTTPTGHYKNSSTILLLFPPGRLCREGEQRQS
ncbi:hypothetical protein BHE74_00034702 [Ensete ventricosum]|nr:hypothetical protein GW17_00051882 [Ensete ventricosum]RWW58429.1 hypothetical protein BHE74_00034702 [Ensete ventricosum]RZS12012.1 hypothetical protein BHM03_00043395 [Ensete ventricosum]